MSIGKRLRTAIKYKKMNLKEFCSQSQVPYRTLHQYLTDSMIPGGESLIKLNAVLSISTNWLLTGNGEMFLNEKQETSQIPKWLIDWWEQADDEYRHWLKIQLKTTTK